MLFEAREGARWQYDNGYMARMELDGEEVVLSQPGDTFGFHDGAVQIKWVAAKQASGDDVIDVYQVTIEGVVELVMKMRPEVASLRTQADGTVHFDLDFSSMVVSHNAHGILGQTYRADHRNRL